MYPVFQIPRRLECLIHELLDIFLVYPRRAQAHVNLRSLQVFGQGLFQRLHIGPKIFRYFVRSLPCPQELFTDIAGEVFVGGDMAGVPIAVHRLRQTEDHALKFPGQFFLCLAGQLCHVGHIHPGLFRNGDGQGLGSGVHAGDSLVGPDGAFAEHVSLALQPAVLVQNLQRAEKVVRRIIGEGQGVALAVNQAVFGRERIVQSIQLGLLADNGLIGVIVHLVENQVLHTFPQLYHAFHALPGGGV